MGVYIKGMEMPKGNDAVTIIIFPNGKVSLAHDRRFAEYAEAVPVPPHGRLIDGDALEKDIDKYIGGEESRSRFHHWVQVQRTVIPDSEEAHT